MASESEYFVIQTAGLTKIFRDFWGHKRIIAVDSLDLEIQNHEIYGLLGPNGSGKSTTIKLLLGLLFPSRGTARILGGLPGDVKVNKSIGYLPEESYLYPYLNARETLDFYARLFGLSAQQRQRRVDSLLDMVGLTGVARRPVGEFSKGMMRRIGLAQALINDPDLLILDEPTAGLDPLGTRQIKDLILEMGRRGKSVLLCSHLLADVEDVCDRIGILYGGKLRTEGTVSELLTRSEATQIRADQLSSDTIAKVENIIRHDYPDCQVEVQTPRIRLEDFFLNIVAEAQAAQLETSGAVMGSGVSDFLSSTPKIPDQTHTVIEDLVAGREHPTPQDKTVVDGASTQSVTPLPKDTSGTVREEVIDSLVGSSTSPSPPDAKTKTNSTAGSIPVPPADIDSIKSKTASASVDRDLIDKFTRGRRKRPNEPNLEEQADEDNHSDNQDNLPKPDQNE